MSPTTLSDRPQSAKRTHCPICGAKIARAELSICAYCASPLDLLDRRTEADGEAHKRLLKIREHADYASALAFEPAPGLAAQRANAACARALAVAGLGLALALIAWTVSRPAGAAWTAAQPRPIAVWVLLAVFCLLAARALWKALARGSEAARLRALPVLKRPALVKDRRSVTDVTSWAWRAQTAYYFKLGLEDGLEAEFVYPGRGSDHELLVPGNTGVAYTCGGELIDFRKIKV